MADESKMRDEKQRERGMLGMREAKLSKMGEKSNIWRDGLQMIER